MLKITSIFILGLIEQYLYTSYLLSIDKRKKWLSTILMFTYLSLFLFIVDFAMKDNNSVALLLIYALSCSIGNFIRMFFEEYRIVWCNWRKIENLPYPLKHLKIYKENNGYECFLLDWRLWVIKKNEKSHS